jgi:hypothetical protein
LGLTNTIVVPSADRSPDEVKITIPDDAAGDTAWAAGLYTVTVVATSGTTERTTNALPMSFAPRLRSIAPPSPVPRDGSGTATLTITCSPEVRPSQRVAILLADREVAAAPHPSDTGTLQFAVDNAPVVNDATVRLRVDGIDSLPFRRQETPPPPRLVFDEAQRVTIT